MGDGDIKDKIPYKAKDSIVYDISAKKMYLYDGAEMHYQKIQLNADAVEFDWTTMIMTAQGAKDSAGNVSGKPVFKDDGKEYRSSKMMYNFKNQKGKVFEVITNEGDAYLHSEAVKRADGESWYGYKSKYTTCNLDHPHFFFRAKKIKLVPNKIMVTGPANLWIADIPTPLYIPFGIFPVKQGRRSGIVMPKYGQDAQNGFFLRDGGYYWAANDKLGVKLTASIYTNGSFDIKPSLNYRVNYMYSGNFALAYIRTQPQDPDLPNQHAGNDFMINWNFQLDPKAAPSNSFSASVNIQTSSANQALRVTDQTLYSTAIRSNINYVKTFPRIPFLSFTISASHSQNLQTHSVDVTLPSLAANINRVTPFKSKISTGKPKWYENIGIAYGLQAKNTISGIDSMLFRNDYYKNLRYGVSHAITLDAPFPLLKYFNVNPNASYNERWYFQHIDQSWVNQDQIITLPGGLHIVNPGLASYVKTDTFYGFRAVRDFSANINLSTKITGIYKFKGKYLKALRHVLTPSIGMGYHPDYGTAFWGYYAYTRKGLFDAGPTQYSHYDIVSGIYGLPSAGKYGAINWSLNNNFDMKVYSKKDSLTHEKKIGVLERLNISGAYNLQADSCKLQPFAINGSMRLWDNITSTFGVNLDPYALGTNGYKINRFYAADHKGLLRFTSANISLNASFHGKSKPNAVPANEKAMRMKADYVSYNPDEYYDFDIPWTLNAGYTADIHTAFQVPTQHDSLVLSQFLRISGDLNLTAKWKIGYSSGYDFQAKQLTVTNFKILRNLHCWQLSFDWTAWPLNNQQFAIELKVLNPTLQDLKLTKRRNQYAP
jgi:hypothetical protein